MPITKTRKVFSLGYKASFKIISFFLGRPFAFGRIRQLGQRANAVRLDLGAGGAGHPGFIGIDLNLNADVIWDLRKGIPCERESVEAIASDHFLEHLPLTQIVSVLQECYRVLIPGGSLRFTVPHIDPYIDAWLKGDFKFLESKINDIPKGQEHIYATPFDRVSWVLLRDGEHRVLFDSKSIVHKVRLVGFKHVEIQDFDPQKDINPRFSSVYVEAIK